MIWLLYPAHTVWATERASREAQVFGWWPDGQVILIA